MYCQVHCWPRCKWKATDSVLGCCFMSSWFSFLLIMFVVVGQVCFSYQPLASCHENSMKCHCWLYLHRACSWILLLSKISPRHEIFAMNLSTWWKNFKTYGELSLPLLFLCLLSLCMRCSTCGCSYNELCLLLFLFVHSLPTPISNLPWSISTWFCSTNNWMIWEVLKWNHDSISAKLNLW